MNEELYFRTKTFKYPPLNKYITIILQKQNGPCMLIAIFNALVLKNRVTITPGRYSSSEIIDLIIGVCPNLIDLSDNLLSLVNGCNVNPIFSSCTEFKGFPKFLKILHLKMYHGMLPDPETPIYDIVQSYDYEQLEMKIFELESNIRLLNSRNNSNEESISIQDSNHGSESNINLSEQDPLLLEQLKYFYNMIQRQVTNFGISVIDSAMKNGDVVIFFRSSHFSVITKYMNRVFTLITDECFTKENYIWETLPDEKGESKYFDADFILSSLTENQNKKPAKNPQPINNRPDAGPYNEYRTKAAPTNPYQTNHTPTNEYSEKNPYQTQNTSQTTSQKDSGTNKDKKKKNHKHKDECIIF